MEEKATKIQYIILVLLLIFGAYKTYNSYHQNNNLPYHHDEWQHLALSIEINEERYNTQYNPYLGEKRFHKDLESGFHLFIASFAEFYKIDIISFYQYFATIFFLFSGLAIFLTLTRLTKNNISGILALIVFIFLKTNVNILGKDFFVPLIMTIPFMFIYILYFSEFLQKNKVSYLYFLIFILLFLILVYPPSFIILSIPSAFFFVLNYKSFRNRKLWYLLVPLFFLGIYFFWRSNITDTIKYVFETLYFEPGWGKLEIKYSIPLFYGVLNTVLALYGFYVSYKNKQLKFFLVFAFISLALTAVFNLFNFSVLIPYSRAIHYSLIAMCPLTAIGLAHLLNKTFKKEYQKYIIIALFFVFLMFSKYQLDETYKFYLDPVIDKESYQSLIWIKNNIGANNILITPYFMTSAVYPLSRNKVISIIPAQVSGGVIDDNLNFFVYDCDKQFAIINNTSANFVLSATNLECNFYETIYQNSGYKIYKVFK